MRQNGSYPCKGFSLLEISIALALIGFLSYSLAVSVTSMRDFEDATEDRRSLENIRTSLLTFVQSNGYLPCPDTDSVADGVENRTGGVCDGKNGKLPYQMLGSPPVDEWDQPFYYAINNKADLSGAVEIFDATKSASYFSNQTPPLFTLSTPPVAVDPGSGNYSVCGEIVTTSCASATPDAGKIEIAAIAVIISFGKNGEETWAKRAAGTINTLSSAEQENADDDNYFWKAVGSRVIGSDFDDQLVWLTGYDLKYALIKSGRGIQ